VQKEDLIKVNTNTKNKKQVKEVKHDNNEPAQDYKHRETK